MPKTLNLSGYSIKDATPGKRGSGDGELAVLQAAEALADVAEYDIVAIAPDGTDFDKAVALYGGDCKVLPVVKGPDGWEIEIPEPKKKKAAKKAKPAEDEG